MNERSSEEAAITACFMTWRFCLKKTKLMFPFILQFADGVFSVVLTGDGSA